MQKSVMELGAPVLERIEREVSCEVMRDREMVKGRGWGRFWGMDTGDEHAGEERLPEGC